MFKPALRAGLIALAALALPPQALAQAYPTQTIKVVVGFPPGGTTDVIGRIVAQELAEGLGRPTVVDNRDIPDICLQHMIAVMLLDKTVSFRGAHDKPRMQNPATLRQRAKVNLVHDQELATLLPVRVAVVEIELTDGTVLAERVSAVRGTPRNPMTRAEVIDKARDLIAPILGREKSEQLIGTVFAIETVTDVRSLRPLLQRG